MKKYKKKSLLFPFISIYKLVLVTLFISIPVVLSLYVTQVENARKLPGNAATVTCGNKGLGQCSSAGSCSGTYNISAGAKGTGVCGTTYGSNGICCYKPLGCGDTGKGQCAIGSCGSTYSISGGSAGSGVCGTNYGSTGICCYKPTACGTNSDGQCSPTGSCSGTYSVSASSKGSGVCGTTYGANGVCCYKKSSITSTPTPTSTSKSTPTPTKALTSTPTPTQTPTLTPTSTTTPTPTTPQNVSATIVCTIGLHGIGNSGDNVTPNTPGNMSPAHTTRTLTVHIYDSSNTLVQTVSVTITYNPSTGFFTGSGTVASIPSGNYLMTLSVPGFLAKPLGQIIAITQGQTITLPKVNLVTGDINNDNQLDVVDYNALANCFGTKQTTSSCVYPPTTSLQGADINDDGSVGATDYNLLLREFSVQKGL